MKNCVAPGLDKMWYIIKSCVLYLVKVILDKKPVHGIYEKKNKKINKINFKIRRKTRLWWIECNWLYRKQFSAT